ncbi:MAG: hypothetical protein H6845_02550 [Alphaproteobacteria bacterium]|nr:MAG: hypothetical protein H6845_02550 [Alphaproteobacteria bacterium]
MVKFGMLFRASILCLCMSICAAEQPTRAKNQSAKPVNRSSIKPQVKKSYSISIVAESDYYPNKNKEANQVYIVNKNIFSGFLFKNKIVTALSNVANKQRIYLVDQNANTVPLKLVGCDESNDIAILDCQDQSIKLAGYFKPVCSILDTPQDNAESVKILSNYGQFFAHISHVSSDSRFFKIDRKLNHRVYGAPILTINNQLIGVLLSEAKYNQHTAITSQAFNEIFEQIVKYGRSQKAFTGLVLENNVVMDVVKDSPSYEIIPTGAKINSILHISNENDKWISIQFLFDENNQMQKHEVNIPFIESINIVEKLSEHRLNLETFVLKDSYIINIESLPNELLGYVESQLQKLPQNQNYYKTLNGLLVITTDKNSLFKPGDIIKTINNKPASFKLLYQSMMQSIMSKQDHKELIYVVRDGKLIQLEISFKYK